MRNFAKNLLFASAFLLLFSACKKDDDKVLVEEPPPDEGIVYPLTDLITKERIGIKKTLSPPEIYNYTKNKLQVFESPTKEYLSSTTRIDFSKLTNKKFYYQIEDKTLEVYSILGFTKLSPGKSGWWAHWNYSPYVESERCDVLFTQGIDGYPPDAVIILFLSKKVTIFGFEIAPNKIGKDFTIYTNFMENSENVDKPMAYVKQVVSAPSGARLIAVKSKVPFEKISIAVSNESDDDPMGLAITNIRYSIKKSGK